MALENAQYNFVEYLLNTSYVDGMRVDATLRMENDNRDTALSLASRNSRTRLATLIKQYMDDQGQTELGPLSDTTCSAPLVYHSKKCIGCGELAVGKAFKLKKNAPPTTIKVVLDCDAGQEEFLCKDCVDQLWQFVGNDVYA